MSDIDGKFFAIYDTPCCVWDVDPHARNAEFIDGLQPEFFAYLADLHSAGLAGPHRQFASMALSAAYSQGLETFFAVLFAALQAPDCVVGWVTKYRQEDLNNLLGAIGKRMILTKVPLQSPTWDAVVEALHSRVNLPDKGMETTYKKVIVRLWQRLAADFLDPVRSDQYNTIKHGFRSEPGGIQLQIGTPLPDGNRPPAETFIDMGGSEFGSGFFKLESLNQKYQFKLNRLYRNWKPEILADRLRCIQFSIMNVMAFLRAENGFGDAESQKFNWPQVEFIEHALRVATGVQTMTFSTFSIDPDKVIPITKEAILAVYSQSAPSSPNSDTTLSQELSGQESVTP